MKCHLMNSREWVVVTRESVRALELKTQEDQVMDGVGKAIQVKDLLLPFQEMVLGDQVISNDQEFVVVGTVVVTSHGMPARSLMDKIMEFTNSVMSPISKIWI